MAETGAATALADLLAETGQQHHQAFIETDGADPEWPLWYSEYLTGRIDGHVGTQPTKSRIVQCLMNAADAHAERGSDEPWATFYAAFILGLGPTGLSAEGAPT